MIKNQPKPIGKSTLKSHLSRLEEKLDSYQSLTKAAEKYIKNLWDLDGAKPEQILAVIDAHKKRSGNASLILVHLSK